MFPVDGADAYTSYWLGGSDFYGGKIIRDDLILFLPISFHILLEEASFLTGAVDVRLWPKIDVKLLFSSLFKAEK